MVTIEYRERLSYSKPDETFHFQANISGITQQAGELANKCRHYLALLESKFEVSIVDYTIDIIGFNQSLIEINVTSQFPLEPQNITLIGTNLKLLADSYCKD